MKTNFEKVKEFQEKFGMTVNENPNICEIGLRMDLISEEVDELYEEVLDPNSNPFSDDPYKSLDEIDKVKVAKELADLLYVCYGAAVTWGIDIDACFAEVHRSNMSKLGEDGKPVYREDGKVLKGKNYSPADLTKIIGE